MILCEILYHFSQMHFVNEKWGFFLLKFLMCGPQSQIYYVMCKEQQLHDTQKC